MVSNDLVEAIYETCLNQNEKLTVDDLRNCFNFAEIEKKAFQKITLDEFMTPIRAYIQVKQVARQILIDLQLQEQRQALEEQKERDFKQQAIELYKQCAKSREWIGTMFQARVLARPFWESLYEDEKKEIQERASENFIQAQREAELNPMVIVPDKLYFLAQETIKSCASRGKLFIYE